MTAPDTSPGAGLADELERLDKEATPGPWLRMPQSYPGLSANKRGRNEHAPVFKEEGYHGDRTFNIELTAALRNNVPTIIKALRTQPPAGSRAVGEVVESVKYLRSWASTRRAAGFFGEAKMDEDTARLIETLARERDEARNFIHAETLQETRERDHAREQLTIAQRALSEARGREKELREALNEVITNGHWSGGGDFQGEWCISREVYELAQEANEVTPSPGEQT